METDRCKLCNIPLNGRKEAVGEFCCAGCERVYEILTRMEEADRAEYLEAAKRMGIVPSGDDEGEQKRSAALPEDPSAIREERFVCEGMFCPSCGWIVEQVLESSEGVRKARVDYFSGSALVEIDLRQTGETELKARLKPLGYDLHKFRDEKKARIGRRVTLEFLVAAVITMNLMTLSFVRYAEGLGWIESAPGFLPWLELLLALPVLYIGWIPMVFRAGSALARGRLTMDLLIGIGVAAAAFLSLYALLNGRDDIYFETCAGLITISLLSRMIEAKLREKAFADLAPLLSLPVKKARLVEAAEEVTYVDIESVGCGGIARFLEDETVPFDGTVKTGRVFVSEAVLTGEPRPRLKVAGDAVLAGSVVMEGTLDLTVTRRYEDTKLGYIARSVAKTVAGAENRLRSADRISTVFVPSVLGIAVVAWVVRVILFGLDFALTPAGWFPSVAILAVACPCAFSLAGVCAVTAATGTLLRKGVLVKELEQLENLHKVRHVIFDKTGTVTEGKMTAETLAWRDEPKDALLSLVLTAETSSTHPAADAIRAFLTDRGARPLEEPVEPEDLFGRGRSVSYDDRCFAIGNQSLFEDAFVPEGLTPRHSPLWFGFDGHAAGCFLLADLPRPEALEAMENLKQRGLGLELISGDRKETTENVAAALGIETHRGSALAEDKANRVDALRTNACPTAFVGDGTNDALAMSRADVSIALTRSTDEALGASGFVALRPDLKTVVSLFDVGAKLKRVVRTNYIWAFAFNTLFIPVAALGKLVPLVAMILMLVSSTAVLINSLRLRRR